MLIRGHSSSGLLKLLFISMAVIAFGHAMGEVSFEDDYPCPGNLCVWVSPPPVLNHCGPLGDCNSGPTPHSRSKSGGQFGAAPGPLEGQPSPPPVVWEAPPPPPQTSPAPPPIVPGDPVAAPATC